MKIVWLTVTAAVFAMALLFAALANGDPAVAQTADTPTPEATAESSDDFGDQQLPPIEGKLNPPQFPNMDSNLNRIVQQAQTGQVSAQAAAANAPVHSGASVGVTLYITEGHVQDIWDWLEESGASPRNIGADYIEAYIPVSLLAEASQQEGVLSVRTIIPPQPNQGVVVSEGAAAHGAPAWHNAGLKGQGVKIGVIDTGFEGFRSLMGSELPAEGSVRARCYTDIGTLGSDVNICLDASGSKHGAAVTEALFDIAPEAEYYIANPMSFGDLQATVEWMIDQDVDVINHSLAWWWDGPGDGTSPFSDSPLRAVDTAVEGGIVWANSAGNGNRRSWFGPFADTDGDGWHNYGPVNECNTIDVRAGERITLLLRWDDNWLGASRDLDLFVAALDSSGNLIFENAITSEREQSGRLGDYPFEIIQTFAINDLTACVSVKQYRGAAPAWMHLASFRNQELEFHTLSGGIGNPAESANPGLLAVGAAPWNNTSSIEPYSDQGPTPDDRIKPDIVGADRGQSVTLRSSNNPNGHFPGTSQASPHVAGLAALVKQRFPNYSPQRVTQYLKANAEARGAVPNNTWGYGFAKLPASDATTPTPEPTATSEPTPGPTGTPQPTPDPSATAEPTPEPTATPEPTPEPTATPEPTPPPSSDYNIEDHACSADDLAHLDGYTLESTFGPESYEADYTGVTGYYRSTFVADNGPTIVCLGTQYDSVANARWDSLNYSTVLQYAATAVDEIFDHEQAFVSSYIGEDTLGLLLDYEIDDSPLKSSEVIFLDAATLTVTTVRAIQSDSDDYPDISTADGIAKNIAARVIPDDTATQSSSSLLKLFGWLD